MLRHLIVTTAALLLLPLLASGQCLTTLAPNPSFVPPAPYPSSAPNQMFWYGSDALWTHISFDGKWRIHNRNVFREKLVFYARDFDWHKEHEPDLIVTAKRLDGD